MQVPTTDVATIVPVQTGGGVTARVASGNIAQVPLGALLEATVTSVSPREIALTVNGLPLTVRPPAGVPPFQPGTVLLVRVPPAGANAPNPTIELALPAPAQKTAGAAAANAVPAPSAPAGSQAPPTTPPLAASRLAVVDVLAPLPDGRVRVQLDGVEQIATAAGPLAPGGRYVLQVERNSAGIRLSPPPPESPELTTDVATAVLRSPAPTLPAALKPLRAELAALAAPAPGTARPVPAAVREAAVAVENTLRAFIPTESRTPDAARLQRLVENGGLHFEAKLARLVEGAGAPADLRTAALGTPAAPARASPPGAAPPAARDEPAGDPGAPAKPPAVGADADARGAKGAPQPPEPKAADPTAPLLPDRAAPTARDLGPDLKGDLLRLLQAVNDLGGETRAPAAEAAVRGIEQQQAANALAQASATPYFLQIPFPDGGEWRTLRLSLEPQHRPDRSDAERAGRFRVFMHVPLTDLGETWIDAGVAGDQFRATIYLDRAPVRDRVREALPELRAELAAEGFSEVLLDVKSSGELPDRHRRESGAVQAGRPGTVSVLDVRA